MAYFSTPPLQIIDHPADAEHCGGMPRLGYRYIVLHDTDTSTAGNGLDSLAYLSTTPGSGVSCHRYIPKNGLIYKLVPDHVVAWTQGPSELRLVPDNQPNVNQWCLSIEMERSKKDKGAATWPIAQVQSAAWQCAEWTGLYGAIPIVGHTWIQSDKNDPRDFPWSEFYRRLFARLRDLL